MCRIATLVGLLGLALACTSVVQAEVVIDTVTVGNPGNAGELSGEGAGGFGPDRICGAVDYVYDIGQFEIAAAQYTEFLNAVAKSDSYGLYSEYMNSNLYGCQITRTGSDGSYVYDFSGGTVEAPGSTAADWAERPVNFVSWGDAARFCNWLHNGQPSGAQDLTTTEDGSYYLDGEVGGAGLALIVRETDATWVIPTEDEWYKAAYHKNDGVTVNYFDYPTSSDSLPSNHVVEPDPGNSANFYYLTFTLDGPFWRTEIGEFENSASPYGTYDQGGNVWEWNDSLVTESTRMLRGGSFGDGGQDIGLRAACRDQGTAPLTENFHIGFRVARVLFTGDLNCDGLINNGDIDPFVLAVTDEAGYVATYPDCDRSRADCNSDGLVNNGDIDAFVALLGG